jgi:PAS domain S-box-containing protein
MSQAVTSSPSADVPRGSRHPRRSTTARIALIAALAILLLRLVLAVVDLVLARAQRGPTGLELGGIALGIAGLVAALVALRAVDRDVAERENAAALVRASEAKFAGILAIAADAIITVDESQRIVHYNRGAEDIFGWPQLQMLGQPLERLLPERFRGAHRRHLEGFRDAPEVARRMGERSEIYGLRRDGTEFPAEASISRLELGDQRLYTVVLRDITARKRQQADERFLAQSAATLGASLDYESTLRSVAHLAVPHLADCCVLDIDDETGAMRRLASVHEDPGLTRLLRTLESPRAARSDWPFPSAQVMDEETTVARRRLADGWERAGAPSEEAARHVRSLGLTSLITVPLRARGRVVGALTLLATDRRRDYGPEEQRLAEALAHLAASAIENANLYRTAQRATVARDEILGVVSHDLRNPLSAITMCARVLFEDAVTGASPRVDLVDAILESTDLMNRLIQDLLDVSMIESGHLTLRRRPAALEPLARQVVEMLGAAAGEHGVRLEVTCPPDLAPLLVDPARLVQVLGNLMGNAIKFTEGGGTITVAAEADDAQAVISVRDTGTGIPVEHLPHIFDRYWHARRTARTAGTGLGLAIAKGIVEAHGGRIWVESTLGVGSTFRFTVPLVATGAQPARESGASATA